MDWILAAWNTLYACQIKFCKGFIEKCFKKNFDVERTFNFYTPRSENICIELPSERRVVVQIKKNLNLYGNYDKEMF